MIETVGFEINFRPIFHGIAGLTLLYLLFNYKTVLAGTNPLLLRLQAKVDQNWKWWLGFLSIGYLVIGLAAKISQKHALLYSAHDYWLFDDMLRWMASGEIYVTRFAPQDHGPLQHGAIHAYLTWFITVPFVWLFGATNVAVGFNPVVISLGGWVLGRLTYLRTKSPLLALVMPAAYFMSEWMGRTLMYEVHPEAMYPLCIFLVLLAIPMSSRWGIALCFVSWALLAGLKQDAIIVSSLLAAWLTLKRQWSVRTAVTSMTLVLAITVAMTIAVSRYKSGTWGPKEVAIGEVPNVSVVVPKFASGIVGGHPITGVQSVFAIVEFMVERNGGAVQFAKSTFGYFFRNPFLSFALLAPWVFLQWSGWILVIPFALLYAMLGQGLAGLQVYYSAPIFGLFCFAIIESFAHPKLTQKRRLFAALWIFLFAAFYGGKAPMISFPSKEASACVAEVQAFNKERLTQLSGLGVVSSRFLGIVPRERVWSETPKLSNIPPYVGWVLGGRNLPSYEDKISPETWEKFRNDANWKRTEGTCIEVFERIRE